MHHIPLSLALIVLDWGLYLFLLPGLSELYVQDTSNPQLSQERWLRPTFLTRDTVPLFTPGAVEAGSDRRGDNQA